MDGSAEVLLGPEDPRGERAMRHAVVLVQVEDVLDGVDQAGGRALRDGGCRGQRAAQRHPRWGAGAQVGDPDDAVGRRFALEAGAGPRPEAAAATTPGAGGDARAATAAAGEPATAAAAPATDAVAAFGAAEGVHVAPVTADTEAAAAARTSDGDLAEAPGVFLARRRQTAGAGIVGRAAPATGDVPLAPAVVATLPGPAPPPVEPPPSPPNPGDRPEAQ